VVACVEVETNVEVVSCCVVVVTCVAVVTQLNTGTTRFSKSNIRTKEHFSS
jgi:hypothetical protein